MQTRKLIIFLYVLMALLLQACGPDVQAGIATGIAQTQQISALETAAAGGAPVQATAEVGQAGNTTVFVSVSQNTNCRSGPRVDYTLLTTINVGQQVEVLKTFSNEYVLVKNPNGNGDCWLFLQYADTTDFSTFNLAVATQPPTPTATNTPKPIFNWDGSWQMWAEGGQPLGAITITQTGTNISGSFVFDGNDFTFTGSLSSNLQTASGTLTNTTKARTFPFQWQIKDENPDQFVGHVVLVGGNLDWCGSRSGASMPSPCLGP